MKLSTTILITKNASPGLSIWRVCCEDFVKVSECSVAKYSILINPSKKNGLKEETIRVVHIANFVKKNDSPSSIFLLFWEASIREGEEGRGEERAKCAPGGTISVLT